MKRNFSQSARLLVFLATAIVALILRGRSRFDLQSRKEEISLHASRSNKVRKWLTSNKIFFETLSVSTLAGASVFVGVMQYQVASKQSEIAETQTRFAEAQLLPVFEVKIKQEKDDSGFYNNNTLILSNEGGPVYELETTIAYYVDVEASLKGPGINMLHYRMPLLGYYITAGKTNAAKGLLASFAGFNNNKIVHDLRKELYNKEGQEGFEFVNLTEQTYIRIGFKDFLYRPQTVYYAIFSPTESQRMAERAGADEFADWRSVFIKENIQKLTAGAIFKRLKEMSSVR